MTKVCTATTQSGLQCRNLARPGYEHCNVHLGKVRPDHHAAPAFEASSGLVLRLLEAGHSQATAAILAGVNPSTISQWNKRGREAIQAGKVADPYADWYLARQRARHKAAGAVEDALFKNALEGNVSAQLAWLRRRMPDDWGELTQTLKIEGEVIAPYAQATTSELRTGLQAALTRATALIDSGRCGAAAPGVGTQTPS